MQQCTWEGFQCLLWSEDYFADVSPPFLQWHCVWPVFLTGILFHHPISGMSGPSICACHSYPSLFSISASLLKSLILSHWVGFLFSCLFCAPRSVSLCQLGCKWNLTVGWECPSSQGHVWSCMLWMRDATLSSLPCSELTICLPLRTRD